MGTLPGSRRSGKLLAILMVIAGLIILLVALLVIFGSGGKGDVDSFREELNQAAQELYLGYTRPVREVSERITVDCAYVRPGSDTPGCAEFVDTIAAADRTMSNTVIRLDSLLANPPSGVSEREVSQMQGILRLIQRVHESNRLLIEGWREGSEAKWDEGWELRESLDDEVRDSQSSP